MLDYEVLHEGEHLEFLRSLVEEARRRIYFATYIATLNPRTEPLYYALARKRRSGVDVRVVLDGASGEADRYNRATAEFLLSLGVPVARTQRFMHVKLYIVDDYVVVGSHNLTYARRGGRYEISVAIRSRRAAGVLSKFVAGAFLGEEPEPGVYRDVLEDGTYYEVLANHRILQDLYEKTSLAGRRVKVAMYIATMSKFTKAYYGVLREKALSGVDVTVVLDGAFRAARRYNEEVYSYLRSLGLGKVALTSRHNHAKVVVVDDFTVIGSHNLTSSSIAGRLELAVVLRNSNLANAMDYAIEGIYESESSPATGAHNRGDQRSPAR